MKTNDTRKKLEVTSNNVAAKLLFINTVFMGEQHAPAPNITTANLCLGYPNDSTVWFPQSCGGSHAETS